jgi:hypothetical protein
MRPVNDVGAILRGVGALGLVLTFAHGVADCSIPAATSPAKEVTRRFLAEIVAVDAVQNTIRVVHSPSGYRFAAQVTDKTRLTRTRFFDPSEIAEGSIVETWGQIDTATRQVQAGECRVLVTAPTRLIAQPQQNYIAGRLYRQVVQQPEANAWTTADRKFLLGLETADGQRWRLLRWKAPPVAFRHEAGSRHDLRPGRKVEVVVVDRGGQGELVEAVVEVWYAGAESRHAIGRCEGNGPSGMTAEKCAAQLRAVEDHYATMAPALARQMPVRLGVSPQLALVGEPVRLEIRALSARVPQPQATVFLDYFHTNLAESREVILDWHRQGEEAGLPVYLATTELPAAKVGQYLVEWNCDVGGDIAKFSRSYAVCDQRSAVCLFVITAPGSPHPEIDFHKLRVPFDYWEYVFDLPSLAQAGSADWAKRSHRAREFGDTPNFLMEWYPWDTALVCREPAEVQRLAITAVKPLVTKLGFTDRPFSVWSYSLGNVGYRALQETGEFTVTSLCTENHVDGGLEINHWGKPERPYFMSSDDFRKPGPGGRDRLVALSQVQRHTYLARQFFCNYCIEGSCFGLAEPAWSGRGEVVDELAMSRMLDGYDALFQMARWQKSPFYIATGVEFNGARPGATEANRMGLEYAVAKARTGNVVFATSRGVAEFYHRHYNATPESTAYFHDYWAGTHQKDKPDLCPDVMTMEGSQFYALAMEGQILPECEYDYTSPWNFPDFGNDELPRRLHDPACYLLPGKFDKFAATPRLVDTRSFQARRMDRVEGDILEVTIAVDGTRARKNLVLALWNVSTEFRPGEDWFCTSVNCRFVPVLAPYNDNLNGFLVADVGKGANTFRVRFASSPRVPRILDFKIGDSVRGKVFRRNSQTIAYLWPTGPWAAEVRLDLPTSTTARAYVAPEGREQCCNGGPNTFTIRQEQWARLVGLEREEILRYATASHR